jgi:hypothetical protein
MEFAKKQLIKAFDWNKMIDIMSDFADYSSEKKLPDNDAAFELLKSLEKNIRALKQTADTFSIQLQQILQHLDLPENQQKLQERVLKSILYFGKNLSEQVIQPLHTFIVSLQNKKGVRGFLKKADEVEQAFKAKLTQIEKLQFGDTAFYEGNSFYTSDNTISEKLKEKPQKGESHRESLRLYKEGKNIEEIATERNMAVTTIEGHLASFITTGEVSITSFIKENELAEIQQAMDKFTYGQLRMAVAYINK